MVQHNQRPTPQNLSLTGPNPLLLHLGIASQIWLNWPQLWQRLQQKSPNSKPVWSPALQARAAELAQASAKLPPEVLSQALAAEGMRRYHDYLTGIALYREQILPSDYATTKTIQTIGSTRLLDCAPAMKNTPVVLVIPSLVNRAGILDLSAEFGLLRWLVAQNIRPILVDWGTPAATEHGLTIADYCSRLQQFLPKLQQIAPASRLHLLGHCLGGNLALALAAHAPQQFRSMMLLSTPWDFHAGDNALGKNAAQLWQQIAPRLPSQQLIPAALVQSLFALLQPVAVTEKFRQLARHKPKPERLQHFARVEHWLNDGVPLPAAVMRELVEDWYGANLPLRGAWRVGDQRIRPRTLRLPTLVAIPDEDHIVPPASSAALARQLPCATAWHVPLGHIGMIVSRRAKARVWRKLEDWITQHTE